MENVSDMITNNDPSATGTKEEVSTPQGAIVPPVIPNKKSQVVEMFILCIALFFPLFIASLDTSTFPNVYR